MRKKLVTVLAVCVASMAMLTACGTKQQTETSGQAVEKVTITHEKGTVEVPKSVKKAVVFELSVLDTIDALGIEVELGLPSGLPSYLENYQEKATKVGSMKEADMEKIYEFAPDVIFIGGRLAESYEELSKIAPTVYVTTGADTYLEDVKTNVTSIASIFGKEEAAEKQLKALEDRANSTKEAAENSEQKALVLLANEGSLAAYGSGSRYGFIHDTLNVKQADDKIQVSTHGQEASFEYVAEKNPDMIFVIDRTAAIGGSVKATETLNNDLINGTNAAKNNKIVSLDSEIWYLAGGGLHSTMVMVEEIAAAFTK